MPPENFRELMRDSHQFRFAVSEFLAEKHFINTSNGDDAFEAIVHELCHGFSWFGEPSTSEDIDRSLMSEPASIRNDEELRTTAAEMKVYEHFELLEANYDSILSACVSNLDGKQNRKVVEQFIVNLLETKEVAFVAGLTIEELGEVRYEKIEGFNG